MSEEIGALKPTPIPKNNLPQLLAAAYADIYKAMAEKQQEAEKTGKPFFTLVAERHDSRRPLVGELMVIDAALRLDPKRTGVASNLFTERSPGALNNILKSGPERCNQNLDLLCLRGTNHFKMPVVAMDISLDQDPALLALYKQFEAAKKERRFEDAEAIEAKLLKITDDHEPDRQKSFFNAMSKTHGGTGAMGGVHLKESVQKLEESGAIVLAVNATSTSYTNAQIEQLPPRERFMFNTNKVTQLVIPQGVDTMVINEARFGTKPMVILEKLFALAPAAADTALQPQRGAQRQSPSR